VDFSQIVARLHAAMTVSQAQAIVQDVSQAQAIIRAVHSRHASAWLADEADISRRTARRWLSSQAPRSRGPAIIAAARAVIASNGAAAIRAVLTPDGFVAAIIRALIAAGGSITVGRVEVAYDGQDEGDRMIGSVDVDEWMAGDLAAAADALDAGDLQGAADAFSDAIIGGYDHGLEDTLSITDYPDGISFSS
jgi:hypothetical protein